MQSVLIPLIVMAALVGVDQITKWWVICTMELEQSVGLIPGFFEFRYVHNEGAALGLMQNTSYARILLIVMTLAVIAGLVWALVTRRFESKLALWAIVLILAGGVGNLIDRVFRGYVVDFMLFRFSWFPFVFNVADVFVVVGGGLIFFYLILEIVRDVRAGKHPSEDDCD